MSLDLYFENECCEKCGHAPDAFDTNITHNLGSMAHAAGLYEIVWHPEESGIEKAGDMINPLSIGITAMKNNPDVFRKYDAENGWGTYDDFLPWLHDLLEACKQNPGAKVTSSR